MKQYIQYSKKSDHNVTRNSSRRSPDTGNFAGYTLQSSSDRLFEDLVLTNMVPVIEGKII